MIEQTGQDRKFPANRSAAMRGILLAVLGDSPGLTHNRLIEVCVLRSGASSAQRELAVTACKNALRKLQDEGKVVRVLRAKNNRYWLIEDIPEGDLTAVIRPKLRAEETRPPVQMPRFKSGIAQFVWMMNQ